MSGSRRLAALTSLAFFAQPCSGFELIGEWFSSDDVKADTSGSGKGQLAFPDNKLQRVFDNTLGTRVVETSTGGGVCPTVDEPTFYDLRQEGFVTMWVRPQYQSTDTSNTQTLVAWKDAQSGYHIEIALKYFPKTASASSRNAISFKTGSGHDDNSFDDFTIPDDNQWYHVGVFFRNSIRVFVNGKEMRVLTSLPRFTTTAFSVGCRYDQQANENMHYITPGTGLYKVQFWRGARPCSTGHSYMNGRCYSLHTHCNVLSMTKARVPTTVYEDLFFTLYDTSKSYGVSYSSVSAGHQKVWCGDAFHAGYVKRCPCSHGDAGCPAFPLSVYGYDYTRGAGLQKVATAPHLDLCSRRTNKRVEVNTEAPPTSAPPTDVPPTNAPPTNAPPTDVPTTEAPPTNAPPTDVPPTNAPPTQAPSTNAPLTDAPPTDSPATNAPPTDVPPTIAPPTNAPPTAAPPTNAPPTSTPPTNVPPTRAPPTNVPPTDSPATDVPPTNVPPTNTPEAPPTNAPATNAPPTEAPPTSAPATEAPDTDVPATDAPDTSTPATVAPPTGVPPTDAPATAAPRTEVPETSAPDTTVPETGAPTTAAPKVPSAPQTTTPATAVPSTESPVVLGSKVGGVVAAKEAKNVASVASSVSPTSGARISVVMKMDCKVEDVDLNHTEPLDFEFHPLGIAIGDHAHKYFLGAIVCNTGLIIAFLGVNYGVALLQVSLLGVDMGTALYYVRAPGLVYIPLVWLMMGTSISAANLAIFGSRAPLPVAIVGWVTLAACVVVPVVIWACILRPGRFRAKAMPDPRLDQLAAAEAGKEAENVLSGWRRSLYIFVFGHEVWVQSDGRQDYFVEKWGMFFEVYKGGYHWFSVVEIAQILLIALMSVWKPHTFAVCVARNVLLSVILLAFFVAIVYLKPHNALFDYWVATAMSGFMFVAVLLMTIAISMKGDPADTVKKLTGGAGYLLLLTAATSMAKAAYDIILYMCDLTIGRRRTAREVGLRKSATPWEGLGEEDAEELQVVSQLSQVSQGSGYSFLPEEPASVPPHSAATLSSRQHSAGPTDTPTPSSGVKDLLVFMSRNVMPPAPPVRSPKGAADAPASPTGAGLHRQKAASSFAQGSPRNAAASPLRTSHSLPEFPSSQIPPPRTRYAAWGKTTAQLWV